MQKNRIIALMACLALLTLLLSQHVTLATPSLQSDEVTFKTPEDAITYYMEGLTAGDLNKVLQACAIDEMTENFDFVAYVDRLRALDFNAPAPNTSPLYKDLNREQFKSQFLSRVKFFIYGLLSSSSVSTGQVVIMDAEKADAFVKEVDPTKLADIEVKKIDAPNKTILSSDKYKENSAKQAKIYGADEWTERIVLFAYGENEFLIGFTVVRYGDNWKIFGQSSPLAGTPVLGTPTQTTEAEFNDMVNGE